MNSYPINYIPLTFIKDISEIKKLLRNSTIISFLYKKQKKLVKLNSYIENSQYGFTASAVKSGKNKYLRISDIKENDVNWEKVPYCNCSEHDKYVLNENDILIARTGGTTGKSFLVKNPPKDSIFASYLIRIKTNPHNNPLFVNLFLNSYAYWSQIVNLNEGKFRPKANANNLKNLLIPFCDKELQDDLVKISEGVKLKNYDDLINEIQKVVTQFDSLIKLDNIYSQQLLNLNKLRMVLLQDAIHRKLNPQDQDDETPLVILEKINSEKEKLIKENKIKKSRPYAPIMEGEIPFQIQDNSMFCRLGEICNVEKGNLGITKAIPGEYPLVALSEARLSHDEYQFNCRGVIVPLISSTGHGHASMKRIHFQEGKFSVGNILCCIYPILRSFLNEKFLYYYLDIYKEEFFVRKMKGAANVSLKISSIEETPVPIIPISVQNQFEKITDILEGFEKTIQNSQLLIQQLLHSTLKEALQPKVN